MPAQNLTCACCNKSFETLLMIKCCICKKHFKNTCVDISSNELRIITANKGWDWSCIRCREFGNEIKDLKAIILKLQEDIQILKVEKSESSAKITSENFEEIIEEVTERNKRKCNLVVFGITEPNSTLTNESRETSEKTNVTEVLREIAPNINIDQIKPVRIGRPAAGKVRPIRVTLNNEEEVITIVRKAINLKNTRFDKKVFVSADLTPRQQQYLRNVRRQLKERRDAGENNLKLKYINGIPKIISVNSLN